VTAQTPLARGRAAYAERRWTDACEQLRLADQANPLTPEDLQRLATAAYLIGDEDSSIQAQVRAHAALLARGHHVRAAMSAIWLAMTMIGRPRYRTEAAGWIARAQRLLEDEAECGEQGWLLCVTARQRAAARDFEAAYDGFTRALSIGERCGDRDLTALARNGQGRTLIMLNRAAEGFALLDEVIVSLTGHEIGPMIAGAVYCSVLSACHEGFELRRAQDWTAALDRWCSTQPDLVPFRGECLVWRAELLQLNGALDDAVREARQACERFAAQRLESAAAAAHYRLADIQRIRGEFAESDAEYRYASQGGLSPQPGLALLRLAQGQLDAADAAIRLACADTRDRRTRALVLAAAVQIRLAGGDTDGARQAARELSALGGESSPPFLRALAEQSLAEIAVAERRGTAAVEHLSMARRIWQELDIPYEFARARELTGRAYRLLGDEEGAQLEFDAAAETFERIGARPDADRIASLAAPPPPSATPLTGREVEVLRLIATGATNRAIAAELRISEKTVARHVSNIFVKLDLPSRAAATAYAYKHHLV